MTSVTCLGCGAAQQIDTPSQFICKACGVPWRVVICPACEAAQWVRDQDLGWTCIKCQTVVPPFWRQGATPPAEPRPIEDREIARTAERRQEPPKPSRPPRPKQPPKTEQQQNLETGLKGCGCLLLGIGVLYVGVQLAGVFEGAPRWVSGGAIVTGVGIALAGIVGMLRQLPRTSSLHNSRLIGVGMLIAGLVLILGGWTRLDPGDRGGESSSDPSALLARSPFRNIREDFQ